MTYLGDQPWPFPSSLMIGCHAYADDPAVTIDANELEDACWFTRAQVEDSMRAAQAGAKGEAFGAPPPFAVAHHLLNWWVRRG